MTGRAAGRLAVAAALLLAALAAAGAASASPDALRNQHAKQDCRRGAFKDYHLQGAGGDPGPGYRGRVFKLSQDYPDSLPPKEDYPWSAIAFEDGGPVDPEAFLAALLAYGLEGNVAADFYAEDNAVRAWYHMPWMDWNSEIAADWPGTDGREFVHGLTHEFDSNPKTLSSLQGRFVDTWSGAYFNARAGFGIGQVYCDPDDPDPAALNPDPGGFNNFPDGAYIIKLLFTTAEEAQLPTLAGTLVWQGDIFVDRSPRHRNQGPLERFRRAVQPLRLLQIDVAVRDDRSLTGWLFGTFTYDGRRPGKTPWERMVPLGLQWGSNPKVLYRETCPEAGACDPQPLTQQWLDKEALRSLLKPPYTLDHLGYGARLAGPVDNPKAACLGCHQTAGFPQVPIEPEVAALAPVLGLDDRKNPGEFQDFRMSYYRNLVSGTVFSESQLYAADYSLQLSMSLQNFAAQRCAVAEAGPGLCRTLRAWAEARRRFVADILGEGVPGPGGAPLATDR